MEFLRNGKKEKRKRKGKKWKSRIRKVNYFVIEVKEDEDKEDKVGINASDLDCKVGLGKVGGQPPPAPDLFGLLSGSIPPAPPL